MNQDRVQQERVMEDPNSTETKKREFQLDQFEGPLDLLLFLIKQSEINIYDIPIATITEQYLGYLQSQTMELEDMSSFYYMAATLIHIKSQMLLPIEIEYDDDIEDPRAQLVDQLITYQRYRQYARVLEEHREHSEGAVLRKVGQNSFLFPNTEDPWDSLTLDKLMRAYQKAMKRFAPPQIVDILEEVTVPEKMTLIKEKLMARGRCLFSQLLLQANSAMEVVNTVMAILEMAKNKEISIEQEENFADILIMPKQKREEEEEDSSEQ